MKSVLKKKNLAVLKVTDVKDDKELYLHQREAMMALDHSIIISCTLEKQLKLSTEIRRATELYSA